MVAMLIEPHRASVLLVEDNEAILHEVATALRVAGYDVVTACNGREALTVLQELVPDVIVSDILMPHMTGLEMLANLRRDPALSRLPVIFLSSRADSEEIVEGFEYGADDYVPKPFRMAELEARVRSKIDRPPVPIESLTWDRETNLASHKAFVVELEREIVRTHRRSGQSSLALVQFAELDRVRQRFGTRAEKALIRQIGALLMSDNRASDIAGRDSEGRLALLMPETGPNGAEIRLRRFIQLVVKNTFMVGSERMHLTPICGFAIFDGTEDAGSVTTKAVIALDNAFNRLDLVPVRYDAAMGTAVVRQVSGGIGHKPPSDAKLVESLRLPLQIALVHVIGVLVPFLAYLFLSNSGHDIVPTMYLIVVASLVITSALIWIEGFAALKQIDPPETDGPAPPVTAIIAAYLPNEAATIVETAESFLRTDYPGPYQVILAYNTPRDLPVEAALHQISRRDPRFQTIRVPGSTSKAQNVNAALAEAHGDIVGVFDADHHPAPDAFTRAWRWIASGYDVVQGHCLVRNGDETPVARTVAVEFEVIYGVAHPGRARIHGFGIFGGSNGYWRTNLLRETRMHGFMLTEDIDSSLRVVTSGHRICSDPGLVSRELAPVTVKALWNQRMRWAQGWFQVSRKHLWSTMRSRNLGPRQKAGLFYLLWWREVYPWLSLQMWPIIAFWVWQKGTLQDVNWLIPIFVLTSLFTFSAGPGQVLFASKLGAPDIRRNRNWFWLYLFWSPLYSEFKNLIGRVAQIKEVMGERQWKVTPRIAEPGQIERPE